MLKIKHLIDKVITIKTIIMLVISPLILHATDYMPGYPNFRVRPTSNITSDAIIYPNVNSSGFVEMKISGRDHDSDIEKRNKIRADAVYKKIPKDILKGTLKLETRYNIQLEGNLDKDTEVKYNIQKEPDFPGEYNVYIKKKETDLTFGDFNTEYKSSNFLNIKKYVNGVETSTKQDKWRGKATIGTEKSEPQTYEKYGNGNKQYSLGKKFILEGSVIVYINNIEKKENIDYTVNYYEGKVTFSKNISEVDYIKIIYEYTNPMQDFIPALSRKNITAMNYVYNPSQNLTVKDLLTVSKNETITIEDTDEVLYNRVSLKKTPIVLGSESIYLNNVLLSNGTDYFIKNDTGLIRFKTRQLSLNDTIAATYQAYETKTAEELLRGNNSPGPIYLKENNILYDSIQVKIGGILAKEYIDYLYKPFSNTIEFYYDIPLNKPIYIKYIHKIENIITFDEKKSPYSVSVTHINESTSVRDEFIIEKFEVEPDSISGNILVLADNPIDRNKGITLEVDGNTIANSQISIDYYKGEIIYSDLADNITVQDIKVSYYYKSSYPAEISFKSNGSYTYTSDVDSINLQYLPVKYNGINSVTVYKIDTDKALEDTIELIKDDDYTIKYLEDGQKIELSFIPGLSLENAPDDNDQIRINYNYIPNASENQAKSTHKVTDILINKKVNDQLTIFAELANSNYNFSKTSEIQTDQFITEDSNTTTFQLTQSPIVEDSETVFLNGFSQTQGTNYRINYSSGEIRFINQSIPTDNTVEVIYEYYKSDTINQKNVNAYSVESKYTPLDSVTITNKLDYVDPNFLTIGNIQTKKGTLKQYNKINWIINPQESISFLHEDNTIYSKNYSISSEKEKFLTNLNLNILAFKTNHSILYENTKSTQKIIKYDNQISYQNNSDTLIIENELSQKYLMQSKKNTLLSGSKVSYISNSLFNDLFTMNQIIPYYSINIEKKNSGSDSNYNERSIESLGFTTSTSLKKYLFSSNQFDKTTHKHYYSSQSNIIDEYYNYSHLSQYTPFPWLNTNINIIHKEDVSPIPGQSDKLEDRKSFNILRLAPDASMEYLNFPKWMYNFFRGSSSTAGVSDTYKEENAGKKTYNEDRYYATFSGWKPINGLSIPKTKLDTYQTSLIDRKETSYQTYSESDTIYYAYDTGFNYKSNLNILNMLSFNGTFKRSYSNSDTNLEQESSTTNLTTTITDKNTNSYGVSLQLPSIPLLLTSINNAKISYTKKNTRQIDESIQKINDIIDNETLNNSNVSSNAYQLTFSILKNLNSNTSTLDEKSYYNRNKNTNSTGSLFLHKRNITTNTNYKLWSLSNNNQIKFERSNQYTNDSINTSIPSLKSSYDTNLNIDELYAKHSTQLNLSSMFSIIGNAEYKQFTQSLYSDTFSEKELVQIKGTSGLKFEPLSGLKFDYNVSIKQLESNNISKKRGYEDFFKFIYTPIKYNNFELFISLSRDRNWGFGFNEIASSQLLQSSNEILDINIIERDDEVYLGSLNLDITLPINNSEHLEKIIFHGEGYYKRIIDRLNNDNEYWINGILFNVRMEL